MPYELEYAGRVVMSIGVAKHVPYSRLKAIFHRLRGLKSSSERVAAVGAFFDVLDASLAQIQDECVERSGTVRGMTSVDSMEAVGRMDISPISPTAEKHEELAVDVDAERAETTVAYCDCSALARYLDINLSACEHAVMKLRSAIPTDDAATSVAVAARMSAVDKRTQALADAQAAVENASVSIIDQYSEICGLTLPDARSELQEAWRRDVRSHDRVLPAERSYYYELLGPPAAHHGSTRRPAPPPDTPEGAYHLRVISGGTNPALVARVARAMGAPVEAEAALGTFPNGEVSVKIKTSVRGDDVFLVQATGTTRRRGMDVNRSIFELLLLVQAARLASAKRVTVVMPYFGYGVQDSKSAPRVPIPAAAIAMMLRTMKVDHVITCDLHCGQIQGFFQSTPVSDLPATQELAHHVLRDVLECPTPAARFLKDAPRVCIVAPDPAGVARARRFADLVFATGVATCMRRFADPDAPAELVGGENCAGAVCVLVDDIIDTGRKTIAATALVKAAGALRIIACATHGVFSPGACEALDKCAGLDKVVVTDTLDQTSNLEELPKLHVLTVAPLLAAAISRMHAERSISCLFESPRGHPRPARPSPGSPSVLKSPLGGGASSSTCGAAKSP